MMQTSDASSLDTGQGRGAGAASEALTWGRRVASVAVGLGLGFLLLGCGRRVSTLEARADRAATNSKQLSGELHVVAWEEAISLPVIRQYEAMHGGRVRVVLHLYNTNEELLGRLESDEPIDLALPSNYLLKRLWKQQLIRRLDHSRLPNLEHVNSAIFDDTFDYAIPYYGFCIGVGYNVKYLANMPDSWGVFFGDDQRASKQRWRIGMVDAMREVMGITLIHLRYSPNTTNAAEIAQAGELLSRWADQIRLCDDLELIKAMAKEEFPLCLTWNCDINRMGAGNRRVLFTLPRNQNTLVLFDAFVIPTKAKAADLAYDFMDFLHEPEIAASLVNANHVSVFNKSARAFIDRRILNGCSYFFPDDEDDLVFLDDVGEAYGDYVKAWDRFKSLCITTGTSREEN